MNDTLKKLLSIYFSKSVNWYTAICTCDMKSASYYKFSIMMPYNYAGMFHTIYTGYRGVNSLLASLVLIDLSEVDTYIISSK